MKHLQKIVSCLFLASATLSFGCAAPAAEPSGASNEMDLVESASPMNSEDTSDSACTSEEEAIAESAAAIDRPPPRPPRECWRFFQCISQNNERFCSRKFPYLARLCGEHREHGGRHHIE